MIKKIKRKLAKTSGKKKFSSSKNMYVLDTSVLIERVVSKQIKKGKLRGKIIVPNAVLAELEHQANLNQETGYIGLDELSELNNLAKTKKVVIEFQGQRPVTGQIKHAKLGEIDAIVRDVAMKNKAELITADYVQAKSAEASGISVIFIKIRKLRKTLSIEKFFSRDVMSLHLKEGAFPYGKKGMPGSWKLTKLGNKKFTKETLKKISKEIIEKARAVANAFIEISRPGLTIIQYGQLRIVLVKPPLSDGIEITISRPLKKFDLNHYHLNVKMLKRIEKARGIIIAGEPGAGKSTFVQALAEFYAEKGFIVKTVESPRDLQLPEKITQYSKSFASSADIHDILFLSRPDYIIFDEMRDTPDFNLYTDLRLAGSECIGVLHSASPIDAIQRFIGRLEVGMIPSILDTIIYVAAGKISKVLTLNLKVKVPTGMHEADLVRPVIEVKDFDEEKLLYEIYKYGEETVIVETGAKARKGQGKELTEAEIQENRKNIILRGQGEYSLFINNRHLANIYVNGEKRLNKKSKLGRIILKALISHKKLELRPL
ncbi:ATPase [Candidatus Pacearchaeota archaeon ex4484_26]|nr:MAG: ATPase [Candidatus Pacearchaeota archaeon ex4484_26]